MSDSAFFQDVDPNSWMTELCVSLGAHRGNDFLASGTGTFISSNLLITAKHVVQDYLKQFQRFDPSNGSLLTEPNAEFGMVAIQVAAGGQQGAIWQVREVVYAPTTDIAYVGVIPRQGIPKKRYAEIDVLPPAIGSRVAGFGYRKSEATATDTDVNWRFIPSGSAGVVKDIHHQQRDSHFINFPSIHTDARFDGGMSGGPVFNAAGRLCAVISSNMPADEYSDQNDSWAALIWPSLNTKLDIKREGLVDGPEYTVYDLCKSGHISAANINRVELLTNEQTEVPLVKISIPQR